MGSTTTARASRYSEPPRRIPHDSVFSPQRPPEKPPVERNPRSSSSKINPYLAARTSRGSSGRDTLSRRGRGTDPAADDAASTRSSWAPDSEVEPWSQPRGERVGHGTEGVGLDEMDLRERSAEIHEQLNLQHERGVSERRAAFEDEAEKKREAMGKRLAERRCRSARSRERSSPREGGALGKSGLRLVGNLEPAVPAPAPLKLETPPNRYGQFRTAVRTSRASEEDGSLDLEGMGQLLMGVEDLLSEQGLDGRGGTRLLE
jgi:hypothetical protein|mmetsp:Transcript_91089/g.260092  ORF Transcript_91089/g.260092 Transcript_91089/m.260092 type:complete len:261 (+) Transcript_91089:1118-1900(+)